MRNRAGIVVQARMGSIRLPGKALEPVGGRSILEQCLRRMTAAGVGPVVLATTERPEDDVLEVIAVRLGVPVFRGGVEDVLDRFARCAAAFDLDPVVRATADNPATDVLAPERTLALLRGSNADYAREDGLPIGGAVEAMTQHALLRAAALATDPYDREHVTPFIRRRHDLFRLLEALAPAPLCRPDLRLTVDTREDLEWVRELFFRAGSDMPSLAELIAASGRGVQGRVA